MLCKTDCPEPYYDESLESWISPAVSTRKANPRWDLVLLVALASCLSLASTAVVALVELKVLAEPNELKTVFNLNNLGLLFCLQSFALLFSYIKMMLDNALRSEWLHLHTVLAVLTTAEVCTALTVVTYSIHKGQSNVNSLYQTLCLLVLASFFHIILCFALIMCDVCKRTKNDSKYITFPHTSKKVTENIYTVI